MDEDDEVTRVPNPFGNCEMCGHPYGDYDELFGVGTYPIDIEICDCDCHEVDDFRPIRETTMANRGNTGQRYKMPKISGVTNHPDGTITWHLECGHNQHMAAQWDGWQTVAATYVGTRTRCNRCRREASETKGGAAG